MKLKAILFIFILLLGFHTLDKSYYLTLDNVQIGRKINNDHTFALPFTAHMYILKPGYYELQRDVINCTKTVGIYINASNVILDGKGHIIDGVLEQGWGWGIYIESATNVTIRNIIIRDWYDAGIFFQSSNNSVLYNVTFLDDGLIVFNSYRNKVENCTVNGEPLVYLEEKTNTKVNKHAGQIILVSCKNITISQQDIEHTNIAIELWNSSDTKIYNSTIQNNARGIYLRHSDKNMIYHNVIKNNKEGVHFTHSDNNAVFSNEIKNNGFGVYLCMSNSNIIYNNTIINNNKGYMRLGGIYLERASNNTIQNNIIRDNDEGLFFYLSDNNIIHDNVIQNNDGGLYLKNSKKNIICNNTIHNNGFGIYLNFSNSNIIRNNTFIGNGLTIRYSYGTHVIDCIVNGKTLVYMENKTNIKINTNAGQIILVNCRNITISEQNIESTDIAIELWNTNNTRIYNSTIQNNSVGVYFEFSGYNIIHSNTIQSNNFGIYLYSSKGNTIYDNIIHNNSYGIYLIHSDNTTIYINCFIFSNPCVNFNIRNISFYCQL
ncbi:MAG: right-handed parallel beta-helix repeat-containing protein [Candidatus Asgardarchaeia archaeon]